MIRTTPVYYPIASGGLQRVQSAAGGVGNAAAASFTITLGSNATAGNFIAVAVTVRGAVSDIRIVMGGVMFSKALSAWDATGPVDTAIFWGPVLIGGQTVMTVTSVSGSLVVGCGVAAEYSGSQIYPDSVAVFNSGGSANVSTSVLTNTNPNALYIGALGIRCTSSIPNSNFLTSLGSPFSLVNSFTTNLNTTNGDAGIGFTEAIVTTASGRISNATSVIPPPVPRYASVLATFKEVTNYSPGF